MAQVFGAVDTAELNKTMHSHKVGIEHWAADLEQPATGKELGFVESLGSELQHFKEAELESMRASLAWLSDQVRAIVCVRCIYTSGLIRANFDDDQRRESLGTSFFSIG